MADRIFPFRIASQDPLEKPTKAKTKYQKAKLGSECVNDVIVLGSSVDGVPSLVYRGGSWYLGSWYSRMA